MGKENGREKRGRIFIDAETKPGVCFLGALRGSSFCFFKSTSSLNLLSFACSLPPSLPPSLSSLHPSLPSPPQIELLSACGPEGRMSLRCLCSALIAFIKCEMSCGPPALRRGRGARFARVSPLAEYTTKMWIFFSKFR